MLNDLNKNYFQCNKLITLSKKKCPTKFLGGEILSINEDFCLLKKEGKKKFFSQNFCFFRQK